MSCRAALLLASLLGSTACTSVMGLEDQYELRPTQSAGGAGGASPGGQGGAGAGQAGKGGAAGAGAGQGGKSGSPSGGQAGAGGAQAGSSGSSGQENGGQAGAGAGGATGCDEGLVQCSGQCLEISAFASDPDNCGKCKVKCQAPDGFVAVCKEGKCGLSCEGAAALCSGQCVDLTTDATHCGTCEQDCTSQAPTNTKPACEQGACVYPCLPGLEMCLGACADTQKDEQNCGECGNVCPEFSGVVTKCDLGKCGLSCAGSLTLCGNTCLDLASVDHCGSCDAVPCTAPPKGTPTCVVGQCSFTCDMGLDKCGNACVNLMMNENNCGGCGAKCTPPAGGKPECESGSCTFTCDAGLTKCESSCVDATQDPQNCGDCGIVCGSDAFCKGSACQPLKVVQIAVGNNFSCALLNDGRVSCWGTNDNGELGRGNTTKIGDTETPKWAGPVDLGGRAVKIAAGVSHACAVMEDLVHVRCWGRNSQQQLGLSAGNVGDDEAVSKIAPLTFDAKVQDLALGSFHSCALLEGGRLQCWGYNSLNELGLGNTISPQPPGKDAAVGEPVLQVIAGEHHTCVLLANNRVKCWGDAAGGVLGLGTVNDFLAAPSGQTALVFPSAVVALRGGDHTNCVLLADGKAMCWGTSSAGQLGNKTTSPKGDDELFDDPPATEADLGVLSDLFPSQGNHFCALRPDGKARCWGDSDYGEIGNGLGGTGTGVGDDEFPKDTPPTSFTGTPVQIAAGSNHSCALMSEGQVVCWGRGAEGQLGNAKTASLSKPPSVAVVIF